jgi:hypothetical protein
MPSTAFPTKRISAAPDAIAPDGSEVRILCVLSRGGMAMFTLMPGARKSRRPPHGRGSVVRHSRPRPDLA